MSTSREGGRTRSALSLRLFAAGRGAHAARRPIDLAEAVAAAAVLLLIGLWALPPRDFEKSLVSAADSWPSWILGTWNAIFWIALLPPIPIAIAAIVRKRWRILALGGAAAGLALGLALLAASLLDGASADSMTPDRVGVAWPVLPIAIAGAASAAIWPELILPARTWMVRLLVLASLMAVLCGRGTPTAAIAAMLTAVAAAGVARFLVGTSAGHLELDEVRQLLAGLGVDVSDLAPMERRPNGELIAAGTGSGGEPVLVKVHGRDALESRRAARLWRAVWYRDGGAAAGTGTDGLEAETIATLLVGSRDVPVWPVLAAGKPDRAAEVLVLGTPGERIEGAEPPETAAAWSLLERLHTAGFAHLNLSPRALVRLPDGELALTELRGSVLAPEPMERSTDDAQLLVLLAALRGIDEAVAESVPALGKERVEALAPYLQPAALGADLRRAVKLADIDVDDLREAVVKAAGIEKPEMAKLRRVTTGGLVQVGLLMLAASAIISMATGIDWSEVETSIQNASWGIVFVGFLLAQSPRFTQAIATLGAVPARLPYGPVYAMQLATSFLNLALPSAAARMAIDIRFFQRQGVAPATAVTSSLIDSFVGNVIEAILLVLLLLITPTSLGDLTMPNGSSSSSSSSSSASSQPSLIAILAFLLVMAILLGFAIPRFRHRIVARFKGWWPDVKASLAPLRTRRKATMVIGGNLANEFLFAAALATMAHAFGQDISLTDALLVNLSTSLLTMVIPVPGGIGVAEAALIAGLGIVGVPQAAAFGITICYRVSTFYLPPTWGWFALRWLERKRYL